MLLSATLTGACTVRKGGFTVMTNRMVNLDRVDLDDLDRRKAVVGEDFAQIILIFPTKAQVTMEEAVDDALEKGGGDVLTAATVKFTNWYIPLIYGVSKWTVEGDVVKTRRH